MSNGASREMPRYHCHKTVHALKIDRVERTSSGDGLITPADAGFSPFTVPRDYMENREPQVGGYYVVYDDGYKSFSPAKAFEEGYTRSDPVV